MFKKILIANRGEIALRIIRTCKEMGIKTVAVHSTADTESLHVKFADESVCIGPPDPKKSYLNLPSILSAAKVTNVDAIHPGYGFLSENPMFVEVCNECEFTFIGPTYDNMKSLGNKLASKELCEKCGVPMLPSSKGKITDIDLALGLAKEIGYPVILKAAMGGGGRGMKIIREPSELKNAFLTAQSEAQAAFGDSSIYLERYCENPRHVEIQILADNFGNVVHLGERDCSIQRRHQKLIEESPSTALNELLRKKMAEAAIKVVKEANYQNAGTVEFILDQDKNFYFLEVNTRIQVEHPVTEMVTGLDLIKEQILIAAGEKLRYSQDMISNSGHSIECRINAEDPVKFIPSPGTISAFHIPSGNNIRVDSFVYYNYKVNPYYDSMIAKLIVKGENRMGAIRKIQFALEEFILQGINSNIDFYKKIMADQEYQAGNIHTGFIKKYMI